MKQFDHDVMLIGLLQAEDAHNWPNMRTNCLALGTVCASTDSAITGARLREALAERVFWVVHMLPKRHSA
jgi:hypothetical protein